MVSNPHSDFTTHSAPCQLSATCQFSSHGLLSGVVLILDIATGTLVDCLRGHAIMVCSIVFMPNGKGLVSCSQENAFNYWEFNAALSNTHETGGQFSRRMQEFMGHRDIVVPAVILHDGQWIVSSLHDCTVQFWDRHGCMHLTLQGHHSYGTRLSL